MDRTIGVPGSAVGCVLEGRRPLALEVQTLVVPSNATLARWVANGVDGARLGVVAAVLAERAGVKVGAADVYASIPGGFRTAEPGLDLALAMALASARTNRTVPEGLAAVGEVGLGGEIRSVPGLEARVAELTRLGFDRVVVPATASVEVAGIRLHRARSVGNALLVLDCGVR